MADIYVGEIASATMTQTPIGVPVAGQVSRQVVLHLPVDPKVLSYERKQSPHFWLEVVDRLYRIGAAVITSHENPILTPGAGAISVFEDGNGRLAYVSFCQKDDKAPRDPGFRVPRNGFPSSREEWTTMGHLVREAFEEGIFVTKADRELVLGTNPEYDTAINHTADLLVSKTGLKINGTRRVPIIFEDGRDTLKIYGQGSTAIAYQGKGIISWTPETGHNFIKVMRVGMPVEELWLIDGETLPNGELIQRPNCIISLDALKGKKFGDVVRERVQTYKNSMLNETERDAPFLTDKVPRSVLNQVMVDGQPAYQIDWMEESREFLSRENVLRDHSRFGWSALEQRMKLK